MKRLIFCFDGTWNKINEKALTNVALTAAAIKNEGSITRTLKAKSEEELEYEEAVPQIIHYDEGVGTNRLEKYSGGILGKGLYENIKEAYLFLCLNYSPGDEIYIFGFSRGAYTARSFAGFIGNCGIMKSEHIEKVIKAAELYKQRGTETDEDLKQSLENTLFTFINRYGCEVTTCQAEHDWKKSKTGYEDHEQPRVKISYLGVWDTVKTLIDTDRKEKEFHDDDIPECAEAGRHAVALDEHRGSFNFTPWENIEDANRRAWEANSEGLEFEEYCVSPKRAFQEVWFPGTHGGVGGGGDQRGLSDNALLWVLEGAKDKGLVLDTGPLSKVFGLAPTPIAPLDNTETDGALEQIYDFKGNFKKFVRTGPKHVSEVSESLFARFAAPASVLPREEERKKKDSYRPDALEAIQDEVKAAAEAKYSKDDFELYNGYAHDPNEVIPDKKEVNGKEYRAYTVQQGDTLGTIAGKTLGSKKRYKEIHACNKVMIPDQNVVHPGQIINIPTD